MNEIKMKVKTYIEEMAVTFGVYLGDVRQSAETFLFNDLPEDGDIRDQVSLYGLKKLLSDRTSAVVDKVEKLREMVLVMDMLAEGTWAKERVVGAMITGVAVEALAQLRGMSIPQVQAALAAYDKDKRELILGNEAVVKLAAEIKAARTEEELANFDDLL